MAVIEAEPVTIEAPVEDPVVLTLQSTLRLLRERGWCQGHMHLHGRSCLLGALTDAGHFCVYDETALQRAHDLVIRQLEPILGLRAPGVITMWNDHPARTFEEVEQLLLDAIADAAT